MTARDPGCSPDWPNLERSRCVGRAGHRGQSGTRLLKTPEQQLRIAKPRQKSGRYSSRITTFRSAPILTAFYRLALPVRLGDRQLTLGMWLWPRDAGGQAIAR